MQVITTPTAMRAWCASALRDNLRTAFVPTMGALHAGHLALLQTARQHADRLVVSVFVNPTQFGPQEDFARYPRQLEADQAACTAAGVDALFCPAADAMYAPDHSVYVVEGQLTRGLCSPFRPGHFRGVLTVVTQLLNLVQPTVAVFGQKDAQQARLIQRLVRDLHMPVQILIAPTVREPDGLAMSSRNQYLSTDERRRAVALFAALQMGARSYEAGERDADQICRCMREQCDVQAAPVSIEYVEAVDFERLAPVQTLADGVLLAIAARIGRTRLIDNLILGRERVGALFGLV